jgi:uracil-DNA glycosylase
MDAATTWEHVAFANFVQRSVGTSASDRPKSDDWKRGKRAFEVLLATLQPNVILVIGKVTFDQTPDLNGQRLDDLRISSLKVSRALWEMPHAGGRALMSWVYHPSWNRDTQQTHIAVFDELIRRAALR